MEQLLGSCSPLLGEFQPREIVALVWALARLNYHPGEAWLRGFFEASRPLLPAFRADELAAAARAICKLRAAPDAAWVEGLAASFQAQFGGLDAAGAEAAIRAIRDLRAAATAADFATRVSAFTAVRSLPEPAVFVLPHTTAAPAGAAAASAGGASLGRSAQHLPRRPLEADTPQPAAPLLPFGGRDELGSDAQGTSWLESFVSDVHGFAALMSLMPAWMRQRLHQWPRAWAAQRLSLGSAHDNAAMASSPDQVPRRLGH